jgi:2',3'-cyclic-nucleotide 2'-phosphodiesterase (5'-nucleotidase family)
MWTGPAISTFFKGESMVEVMNAMDYDAAATGNHEFDFGLAELTARTQQMDFPMLGANVRNKSNGQVPTEYGILPYAILEVYGLRIGVIGLTTTSTPETTLPANVASLDFIDYETALREVVPMVRDQDVDLLFVPGHVCMYEIEPLAEAVSDLNIDLLGGGHCNELVAQEESGTVLLEGGSYMRDYAWAKFTYDVTTESVIDRSWGTKSNDGSSIDAEVQAVIDGWSTEEAEVLGTVIGYTVDEIAKGSAAMNRLVTESVLEQFPDDDLYIMNKGGVRDPIPTGDITLASVVGALPFENTIVRVQLTGSEINTATAQGGGPIIGGGYRDGSEVVLNATGQPVVSNQTYSVLLNSFIYQGGDGYTAFMEFDPDGVDTGTHYRDPVITWIDAQNSTPSNPLEP